MSLSGVGEGQGSAALPAAEPLQLLRYDDASGRFELGARALEALRACSGAVGVVAVCGRARQGKSYVLNRLLGRSSGFTVGPTVRPCTKGLWLWSVPVESADGTHLVLLDSEGIDAYDQTAQYSTQIFAMAVLMSSTFVYNQMGGIDEAALDRLALVTELCKHVRVRSGAVASEEELGAFAPDLVWLLRDFYLDLEDEGRAITTKDYLERALAVLPGQGQAAEAKNEIRRSITALFPRRNCVALVRPCADEKTLRRLDEAPAHALRPEFLAGVEALTESVLRDAKPKMVDGCVLTGPALAALAEAYVGAINDGAVPAIATAWQGVAEGECRKAADGALRAYEEHYTGSDPQPEEAELAAAHTAALEVAVMAFRAGAMGNAALREGFEAKLTEECARRFAEKRTLALARADAECAEAQAAAAERVRAAAAAEGAGAAAVAAAVDEATELYLSAAAGPSKLPRLVAFLRAQLGGAVIDAANAETRGLRAERDAAGDRAALAEERLVRTGEDLRAARADGEAAREAAAQAARERDESLVAARDAHEAARGAASDAEGARSEATEASAAAADARSAEATATERMVAAEAAAAVAEARAAEADERAEAAEAAAERARVAAGEAEERAAAADAKAAESAASASAARLEAAEASDDLEQRVAAALAGKAAAEGELAEARAELDESRERMEAVRSAIEAARERASATEVRAARAVEDAEVARVALEEERRAREAAEGSAAAADAEARAAEDRVAVAERSVEEARRAAAAAETAERAASGLAAQEAAAAAVCAQREARMAAQLARHLEQGRQRKQALGERVRRWASDAERAAGGGSGSSASVAVAAAAAAAEVLKAGRRQRKEREARTRAGKSSSSSAGAVPLAQRPPNSPASVSAGQGVSLAASE